MDKDLPNSRLSLASSSLPGYARPIFAPPATSTQIAVLEVALGCRLPPSVRSFFDAQDSISAMDVHNGYSIGDSATLARSILRRDFPNTIDSTCVFPIGSDGGGNPFLMPLSEEGPIWKWRHDAGEFVVVADSFDLFLDRLADDFRMFAAGRTEWDYMAG